MAKAHTRTMDDVDVQYAAFLVDSGRPGKAVPILRHEAAAESPFSNVGPLLVIALERTGDHRGACRASHKYSPLANDALRQEAERLTADCPSQ